MSASWRGDRGVFFVAMAWLALAIALAGFSTTYILPMAAGDFFAPAILHVHGALFLSWLLLLITQASLARAGLTFIHIKLGWVGPPLAMAMAITGVGAGLFAVHRDLDLGAGDAAYSTLPGVLTAMAAFAIFVATAIGLRSMPDWHKRLMLLATIAILWPAWFRLRHLMPWMPRPDIWLGFVAADSLILIAMVRDQLAIGRVHNAYWIFGVALIALHLAEVALFGAPQWAALSKALYQLIAGGAQV